MRKLTILMVTGFPCIRALKESLALKQLGHKIILLCTKKSNNLDWNIAADGIYLYNDVQSFILMLKVISKKAHIIHCHNEPNWHAALAIELINHIPVIFDCHDFTSMYQKIGEELLKEEQICFENSDAVVHVSEGLEKAASEKYKQKKSLVLYSMPSKKTINFTPKYKLKGNHVAYQGGLSCNLQTFKFRYYFPYFYKLSQSKIHSHVFPSEVVSSNVREYYFGNAYIHVYPTLEYKYLLRELSTATWGLTGFYRDKEENSQYALYLDNAMPNKLFEYLYTGLTPIVINCNEAARFVTEHNIGYAVSTMDEFAEIVCQASPLRKNVDFSIIDMDLQILKLENLYYELLG